MTDVRKIAAGLEAWKANGGVARLVLTALAVIFALMG